MTASDATLSKVAYACAPSPASWREHRSRGDGAQRARRRAARSAARRAHRRGGRRRRHHRPSARGPPAHRRCRHRRADARAQGAAQLRDGGDRRRWSASRCATARMPPASCPRSARSGPPRAGSTRAGQHNHLKPMVARLSDAGIRVSLFIEADPAPARGGGDAGRAGRRAAHRPLLRARGRRAARRARASAEGAPRCCARLGLECHAGHGLELRRCRAGRRRSPRCASSISATSWSARRSSSGWSRRSARCAASWTPRARRSRRVILGIGNDLIDIRRIEKSLERFGDRFVQRDLHRDRTEALGGQGDAGGQLRQALRRQGGLLQGAGHRPAPRRLLARHGRRQPSAAASPPWR